jgi:UDP-glucose 4-epimerase
MAFNKFIKSALKGEKIEVYGDGSQTRDFTYISDVIDATISAINSNVKGKTMNVGGGCKITVNETIKILESLLGSEINVKYVETQKGDAKDTLASIDTARKLLNYNPKVKLAEGLRREMEWIKSLSSGQA